MFFSFPFPNFRAEHSFSLFVEQNISRLSDHTCSRTLFYTRIIKFIPLFIKMILTISRIVPTSHASIVIWDCIQIINSIIFLFVQDKLAQIETLYREVHQSTNFLGWSIGWAEKSESWRTLCGPKPLQMDDEILGQNVDLHLFDSFFMVLAFIAIPSVIFIKFFLPGK